MVRVHAKFCSPISKNLNLDKKLIYLLIVKNCLKLCFHKLRGLFFTFVRIIFHNQIINEENQRNIFGEHLFFYRLFFISDSIHCVFSITFQSGWIYFIELLSQPAA